VENLKIKSTSPGGSYETNIASFHKTDLPNLKIKLNPLRKAGPPGSERPPGLLQLELTEQLMNLNWKNVNKAKLEVFESENQTRILGREGKRSILDEPLPLKKGRYFLYGFIKNQSKTDLVMFRTLNIQSRTPEKRKLSAQSASSISGQLNLSDNFSPEKIRLEISLKANDKTGSTNSPGPLRTTVSSDGSFQFNFLPPDHSLSLHVISVATESTSFNEEINRLKSKSITPLSPGEKRSLSAIDIQNPDS
jgi:hypothetical protein